jgi:hypothetical protein
VSWCLFFWMWWEISWVRETIKRISREYAGKDCGVKDVWAGGIPQRIPQRTPPPAHTPRTHTPHHPTPQPNPHTHTQNPHTSTHTHPPHTHTHRWTPLIPPPRPYPPPRAHKRSPTKGIKRGHITLQTPSGHWQQHPLLPVTRKENQWYVCQRQECRQWLMLTTRLRRPGKLAMPSLSPPRRSEKSCRLLSMATSSL